MLSTHARSILAAIDDAMGDDEDGVPSSAHPPPSTGGAAAAARSVTADAGSSIGRQGSGDAERTGKAYGMSSTARDGPSAINRPWSTAPLKAIGGGGPVQEPTPAERRGLAALSTSSGPPSSSYVPASMRSAVSPGAVALFPSRSPSAQPAATERSMDSSNPLANGTPRGSSVTNAGGPRALSATTVAAASGGGPDDVLNRLKLTLDEADHHRQRSAASADPPVRSSSVRTHNGNGNGNVSSAGALSSPYANQPPSHNHSGATSGSSTIRGGVFNTTQMESSTSAAEAASGSLSPFPPRHGVAAAEAEVRALVADATSEVAELRKALLAATEGLQVANCQSRLDAAHRVTLEQNYEEQRKLLVEARSAIERLMGERHEDLTSNRKQVHHLQDSVTEANHQVTVLLGEKRMLETRVYELEKENETQRFHAQRLEGQVSVLRGTVATLTQVLKEQRAEKDQAVTSFTLHALRPFIEHAGRFINQWEGLSRRAPTPASDHHHDELREADEDDDGAQQQHRNNDQHHALGGRPATVIATNVERRRGSREGRSHHNPGKIRGGSAAPTMAMAASGGRHDSGRLMSQASFVHAINDILPALTTEPQPPPHSSGLQAPYRASAHQQQEPHHHMRAVNTPRMTGGSGGGGMQHVQNDTSHISMTTNDDDDDEDDDADDRSTGGSARSRDDHGFGSRPPHQGDGTESRRRNGREGTRVTYQRGSADGSEATGRGPPSPPGASPIHASQHPSSSSMIRHLASVSDPLGDALGDALAADIRRLVGEDA